MPQTTRQSASMNSKQEFCLLFVDDDPLLHQSLKMIVPVHWRVISCQNPELVPYGQFFHLAMVDMHLTKNSKNPEGLEVIKKLVESQPLLEIVAASGDWSRDLMESALKAGAQKFLGKPWQVNEVHLILEKAEALWNLRHAGQNKRKTVWIGNSSASQELKRTISRIKGETTPVLIEGETGTGKEVVARILHEQEPTRPFIAINISAIPDHLFESEMFGHVKGAFTGADQNKMGLIEAAQGGDLFLDEIEEFPLIHQAKLLRFLESGEVRKVGAKESFKVQTRLIAASNKPVESLVKAGSFREDLFFRLASTRIQLTPLRQRLDDLNELSHFFLELQKPRQNKKWTEDGLEALLAYPWPGNARELKRLCEQLALTSPLPIIRAEDVKPWLSPRSTGPSMANIDYSLGLTQIVENFEKQILENYLKLEPDVEKAAVALQISKSNLYKKIKDYSIKLKGDH